MGPPRRLAVEGGRVQVRHFKFGGLKKGLDPNDLLHNAIRDGPLLAAFRTEAGTGKTGKGWPVRAAPEYLLFLRRLKDGRYEPVSGRIDPALSVREVSTPLDNEPGGK
jgi:hypothetical protein